MHRTLTLSSPATLNKVVKILFLPDFIYSKLYRVNQGRLSMQTRSRTHAQKAFTGGEPGDFVMTLF